MNEMTDIEILNKMIKDNAKLVSENKNGKMQVTLKEDQFNKSSAIIVGLPKNTIVIKADHFKSPDTIFNGDKGECKRADFVFITESNNKKYILCIEMKARYCQKLHERNEIEK